MKKAPTPKLLFVAESVTLAHFARPFELSNRLSSQHYDIHFACDKRCLPFLKGSLHTLHDLHSISMPSFKKSLDEGKPLYDLSTLKSYVDEDLALIERVKPDVIIGDFRLSLQVSARLAKVPYITIANAYWSPYAPQQYLLPCIPVAKTLGVKLGSLVASYVAPWLFKWHAMTIHRLRKHYELPQQGLDLRRAFTDADYTLYADLPSLFPLANLPANHTFIGPILWAPQVVEPDWWQTLPNDRPIVYVTMGSSGSSQALTTVLNALGGKHVTVIASSAGVALQHQYPNVFMAPYIDGNAASARADLVICNGGSLTCQAAFAFGKPVLAIASNLDQFLNMAGVAKANAGLLLRSDNCKEADVYQAYQRLMNEPLFAANAKKLQIEVASLQSQHRFEKLIASLTS